MRNLVNFHPTTQKSENFFSIGSFCPKYTRFQLQKNRGVTVHDTEQWCKTFINSDLVVSKMAWGIGEPSLEYSKVWKIVLWWALFLQSIKVSARKLCHDIPSLNDIQNLKENWLLAWKITLVIWLIFIQAVESLKTCTLMGPFCPKNIKF